MGETFSLPVVGSIIVAVATFFSGVITWLWRVKQSEISNWKDRYGEQQKENEKLWKYPEEAAMRAIAAADAVFSEQIKKLRTDAIQLQDKLQEKERQLSELQSRVDTDLEKIEYLEESKQMLERKIEVYNTLVESLASKKEIAETTLNAFRSNIFQVDDLPKNLGTELNSRLKEVDRTSFGRTARAEGERVAKRARASAVAEHAALAEKERQEAIAKGANKKHAHFDDHNRRSSRLTPKN
jgi:chromosome segregation ATPase